MTLAKAMFNRLIPFYVWLAICISMATNVAVAQYPAKPSPPHLVNDFTNTLSGGELNALEQKLVAYNDSTSTQIAIVIIPTTNGADIGQYTIELFNKWEIGDKQKDNGVLINVAKNDRNVFIVTGRGVEEYLPDAICKRIVTNKIVPNFKQDNYYGGLNDAVDEMISRLSGTFVNDKEAEDEGIPLWIIVLIIFIILFVLPNLFGGGGGGGTYSRRGYNTWGSGPILGGGGWSSGRGGWSSGSSGGFGEFGGGSSGGGGAGGSW